MDGTYRHGGHSAITEVACKVSLTHTRFEPADLLFWLTLAGHPRSSVPNSNVDGPAKRGHDPSIC
jgi:hypothetical protein